MTYPYPQGGYPGAQAQPTGPTRIGPFSLRDLVVVVAGLVTAVASFLPVFVLDTGFGTVSANVWRREVLPMLVLGFLPPVLLAVLTAARALGATVPRRLGTLDEKQVGSVFAVVSALSLWTWLIASHTWGGVGFWLAAVANLALLLATVFGRHVPAFAEGDPAVQPSVQPAASNPYPVYGDNPSPQQGAATAAYPVYGGNPYPVYGGTPLPQEDAATAYQPYPQPTADQPSPAQPTSAQPASAQSPAPYAPEVAAFWFAVPEQRACLDPATGAIAFFVDPGTWYLAVGQSASSLTVQTSDGRTGVLHDTRDIHRA
jgi:hypothetical protein